MGVWILLNAFWNHIRKVLKPLKMPTGMHMRDSLEWEMAKAMEFMYYSPDKWAWGSAVQR